MIVASFFYCVAQLVKDRATWVGGITSTIATAIAKDGFLPNSLEAWLAAVLTICTITYMVIKIILLLRKETKRLEDDAAR